MFLKFLKAAFFLQAESKVKIKPSVIEHRPSGPGWIHLVREKSESPRGPGRWYANISRDSDIGGRAFQFVVWFEEKVKNQAVERLARSAPVPQFSLWVHESTSHTVLDMRTDGIWRAIEEMLRELRSTGDSRPGLFGTSTTLLGLNLGKYEPALNADDGDNLLVARVYDIASEHVTDFWMPSREKRIAQIEKALDRAADQLKEVTPEVPRLDEATLPRVGDIDGRSARTTRALDPQRIASFFQRANEDVEVFVDRAHDVLQEYLKNLAGEALPTLEENKLLAQRVLELADKCAAKLFFRTSQGEIKQVRLRAVPVTRPKESDSPVVKAGKFAINLAGGYTKTLSERPTFPVLVAARDATRAERVFAALDAAAAQEKRSEADS
jgi:hypothetical protein